MCVSVTSFSAGVIRSVASLDELRQMARETSCFCSLGQIIFANRVYKVLELGHLCAALYLFSINMCTTHVGLGFYLMNYDENVMKF